MEGQGKALRMIRVFPRRTKATPIDELAFVGLPPFYAEADRVDISVTFTWDIPEAERLAEYWKQVAPVSVGGPAYGQAAGDFVPGKYLKPGYVITSRGCRNHCWFCSVWKREGGIRELPITEGWNLQDDNLLACSDGHINAVFEMLRRQPEKIQFTGGLEAKLLKPWHVDLLRSLKVGEMFFAYDTPDDFDPLVTAGRMLKEAGFTRYHMRCYVLIGFPGDSMDKAEGRMMATVAQGFYPQAMLWRDETGHNSVEWERYQRLWARPAIIATRLKVTEPGGII